MKRIKVNKNDTAIVYLAGGFKSDWQDKVIQARSNIKYFDPRYKPDLTNPNDPNSYTNWDLSKINRCDIFIIYLEKENPGVSNCSFEAGFACSLNKYIITIDEKQEKYYEMLKVCSNRIFNSLDGFLDFWKI